MARTNGQLGLTLYPEILDTPAFRAAWVEWIEDRRERRLSRYTAKAQQLQFERLAEMGHDEALAAIKWSIAQGYKGIFQPSVQAAQAKPKPPSAWELRERIKECENERSALSYDKCCENAEEVNAKRAARRSELSEKIHELKGLLTQ